MADGWSTGRHSHYRSHRRGHTKFKLAVIGRSNSGKSSLIKALLRSEFQLQDECLPVTDFLESTYKCDKYDHPDSPVELWDVPGCGTQDEPIDGYDKRIGMEKYDGFIVCCSGPATEYEISLNNLIAQLGKRYLFVRTRIDFALENDRKSHPLSYDMNNCLNKIRKQIEDKISDSGVPVYLVSTRLNYTEFTENLETLKCIIFDQSALVDFMRSSNRRATGHTRENHGQNEGRRGRVDWKRF